MWTVHIRPMRGNQGDNRKESQRRNMEVKNQTIVNPEYDEEPALQRRRHKPDTTSSLKASSEATEGVLDSGVLRCAVYSIWAGLMGREDKAEDYPPCPGRTPICMDGKFGVQMYCFLLL